MSTAAPNYCAHCTRPIYGMATWLDFMPYHSGCVPRAGPTTNNTSTPVGAGDGCGTFIPRQLTEADVRRIVREELGRAAIGKEQA